MSGAGLEPAATGLKVRCSTTDNCCGDKDLQTREGFPCTISENDPLAALAAAIDGLDPAQRERLARLLEGKNTPRDGPGGKQEGK